MNDAQKLHLSLFEGLIQAIGSIVDSVPALHGLTGMVRRLEANHQMLAAANATLATPEVPPPPSAPTPIADPGPQPDHTPDEPAPAA